MITTKTLLISDNEHQSKKKYYTDLLIADKKHPYSFSKNNHLSAEWIDTPVGPMLAIANENALFLLEFIDRRGLEKEIEHLKHTTQSSIVMGTTKIIMLITQELHDYFTGTLTAFTTPIHFFGSTFQQKVWQQLQKIPYGTTISYSDLAHTLGKPTAFRAVAQANGANQLAIIIPCHRVINSNGKLAGYGGGLHNKEYLINHEKKVV